MKEQTARVVKAWMAGICWDEKNKVMLVEYF